MWPRNLENVVYRKGHGFLKMHSRTKSPPHPRSMESTWNDNSKSELSSGVRELLKLMRESEFSKTPRTRGPQ